MLVILLLLYQPHPLLPHPASLAAGAVHIYSPLLNLSLLLQLVLMISLSSRPVEDFFCSLSRSILLMYQTLHAGP